MYILIYFNLYYNTSVSYYASVHSPFYNYKLPYFFYLCRSNNLIPLCHLKLPWVNNFFTSIISVSNYFSLNFLLTQMRLARLFTSITNTIHFYTKLLFTIILSIMGNHLFVSIFVLFLLFIGVTHFQSIKCKSPNQLIPHQVYPPSPIPSCKSPYAAVVFSILSQASIVFAS